MVTRQLKTGVHQQFRYAWQELRNVFQRKVLKYYSKCLSLNQRHPQIHQKTQHVCLQIHTLTQHSQQLSLDNTSSLNTAHLCYLSRFHLSSGACHFCGPYFSVCICRVCGPVVFPRSQPFSPCGETQVTHFRTRAGVMTEARRHSFRRIVVFKIKA